MIAINECIRIIITIAAKLFPVITQENTEIENIINTGYINNSTKTVNEYVGCNGEVYDYSCYGHLYEAAWFIMYEGEIKNDAAVKTLGKNILDYCLTKNNGKKLLR